MQDNYNSPLNIRLLKNCPICQHEYQMAMVQILQENELGLLTYITCTSCGAHLLTRLANMPQGIVGNAILTDLRPEEVVEYAGDQALTADEVLAIHELINNNFYQQIRLEQ